MMFRATPLEGDFVGAAFRDGCDQDERDIYIELMGRVARALLNGTPFPRWRGPHPNATLPGAQLETTQDLGELDGFFQAIVDDVREAIS
jgi:hypothetical protein